MAHPFADHREHRRMSERVSRMTKGYASGGHTDVAADRKLVKSMVKPDALKIEGRAAGGRIDKYARGGKVAGRTNVNVIVAPQGGGGLAGPGTPPIPVAPPPAAPPALPMQGMPGMPQRRGGRAYASGGSVKEQSIKAGTPVMNSPGKNDQGDVFRGRQITYAKGGKIKGYPIEDGAGSGPGRLEKIGKKP